MSALSDIIFPEQATNFSSTLRSLKHVNLSVKNRLLSIIEDAEFVQDVSKCYGLPLVANERCGSWYIPPDRKAGSVYFKSTDGHAGQWSFSLRRLNLQLLNLLSSSGGCIVVDSTRRGKSMSDALSKTVPIWCAVINRMLFPGCVAYHALHTPVSSVARSEHQQILDRLQGFVNNVEELHLNLSPFTDSITKPLRPIWVTRDMALPLEAPDFDDFTPIVLCTASRRVHGAEISAAGYIQGAGDDSESWAHGLNPPLFWHHRQQLLEGTDEEIVKKIQNLVSRQQWTIDSQGKFELIQPTTKVYVGCNNDTASIKLDEHDILIRCAANPQTSLQMELKGRHLCLQCREGKLGSRDLRQQLTSLSSFITKQQNIGKIYIGCPTGKDLSVGVALALLCLFFDDDGQLMRENSSSLVITKPYVKQRLSWIMVSHPDVKPSRSTLQSVNDYLFSHCTYP